MAPQLRRSAIQRHPLRPVPRTFRHHLLQAPHTVRAMVPRHHPRCTHRLRPAASTTTALQHPPWCPTARQAAPPSTTAVRQVLAKSRQHLQLPLFLQMDPPLPVKQRQQAPLLRHKAAHLQVRQQLQAPLLRHTAAHLLRLARSRPHLQVRLPQSRPTQALQAKSRPPPRPRPQPSRPTRPPAARLRPRLRPRQPQFRLTQAHLSRPRVLWRLLPPRLPLRLLSHPCTPRRPQHRAALDMLPLLLWRLPPPPTSPRPAL